MSAGPAWERVDALFDRALDVPTEARAVFVATEAGNDTELRDAVLELLAMEAEVGDFLATGPELPREVIEEMRSLDPRPGEPPLGDRIDRYRLVEVLGRGGTSTVYLAERADGTFEQQVALKLLRYDSADGDLTARLRTEQQILARLSHPDLAKVFDGGVTEDGHPYLVVERVTGETVTEHADHRRLPVGRRLELFVRIAHAVHYAHRNLVVHRDLKPSNILVTEDGHPKLLDFGIAKILDPEATPGDVTAEATRWMTPRYAAPEQILGDPVTTATDVHALGVILYELLAGTRPYGHDTSSRFEIERAICETEPVAPSAALRQLSDPAEASAAASVRGTEPARLGRRLSGDLDAIVLKALRKEPEERYASAEAMAEDVRRYLDGFPVRALGGARAYRFKKFVHRHRAGVAAGAVFVLLLAASAATLAVQQSATALARDQAEAAAADAEREAENAQATIDFLADVFRGDDPSESPDAVTTLDLVEWGEERIDAGEFEARPEVEAELLLVLGNAYRNLGYLERGRALLRRSLELRQELYGSRSTEVADALVDLAANLRTDRDFDSAQVVAGRLLDIRRSTASSDEELSAALIGLGFALRNRGLPDSAAVLIEEAVEIRGRNRVEEPGLHASALLALAVARRATGEWEEAEALYRDGIDRFRAVYGPAAQELPLHLNNYAFLLNRRGDYAGSAAAYREALEGVVRLYGRGHPESIMVAQNLASSLFQLGHTDELDAVLSESVAAARAHAGRDDFRVASILAGLGRSRILTGRPEEALAPLLEAEAIYARELGAEHDWTVMHAAWIGVREKLVGNDVEGRRRLEQALERVRTWDAAEGGIQFEGVRQIRTMVDQLRRLGLEEDAEAFAAFLPEEGP